jgi:hypothetical protein
VHRPVSFSETPATSLSTLNNKHWQMNQRIGATKFDNPKDPQRVTLVAVSFNDARSRRAQRLRGERVTSDVGRLTWFDRK